MAAPNSAQIKPSGMTMSRLAIHPNMHCGPPPLMVAIMAGMVMNGPMPIMLVTFNAVARRRPKRRSKWGSAGGFTTLAALARKDTPFAAGADYFGVADLEALASETHKFESRYLDGLLGPYPADREIYRERSPIHHVDELSRPLIVLQGLEDEVVPPNQSEMIVEALRIKGVPVAYLAFEGEQHGFRRAENIRRAMDAELSFYAQVLRFTLPADEGIEPVTVENG